MNDDGELATAGRSEDGREIDAVYLWVDGEGEELDAALAACDVRPVAEAVAARRFRENGELRYSLRSLAKNAPWIRRVFIVTNGQVPRWLAPGSAVVVPHERVFRHVAHLPTWNSRAIELAIHRIPGLTEHFLYLNDDMFLGRPAGVADFVNAAGGVVLRFERYSLNREGGSTLIEESWARTQDMLDELYGRRSGRRVPAHVPRLMKRSVVREIERLLPDAFWSTSAHRFRCASDFSLWMFYPFHLLETADRRGPHAVRMMRRPSREYAFCMIREDVEENQRQFECIARLRPRFFCVNDDLDALNADHPSLDGFRRFLEGMFPSPSRFEVDG